MRTDAITVDRRRLLSRWGQVTAGLVAIIGLGLVVLGGRWSGGPPPAFLAAVAFVVAGEIVVLFGVVYSVAPEQRTPGPPTLATWVTISRAAAVAVLGGFVAGSAEASVAWVPAALFVLAAGLDAIDGPIARVTDSVTAFGSRLDVETDALAVFVGTIVAVVDGALPHAFLAVALARYLFVVGRWWRRRTGRQVFDLPANRLRRPLGAVAMLAVFLALSPVPGDGVSRGFGTLVLLPFLANFCWDWLAVTGRLDTAGGRR